MKLSKAEFETLYKEHQPQLKSFLYRLVTDTQVVEDLSQDAFIKAYSKVEAFEEKSTFKTWLFSIATNLVKDHFKAQKRWQRHAQDNCSQSIKNDTALEAKTMEVYAVDKFDIQNHIDYCFTCVMKYLPLERQIALMLADIYAFKVAEIADIMQQTVSRVKHLLFNGRTTMKEVFEEDCTLIHKTGACWKCSELSNSGNSKAETQEKIATLALVKAQKNGKNTEELYQIRTKLIQGINPLASTNFQLHDFLLHQTNEASDKSYPKIDRACGE